MYRKGCFVLEAKQGSNAPVFSPRGGQESEFALTSPHAKPAKAPRRRGTAVRNTHGWDEAMLAARGQAEQYAKALPASEGWPPFLITVDVGHSFELFADFSLTGKAYLPFPDPRSYRVLLHQLADEAVRERLRAVWLAPGTLDPSRRTARITREVAAKLAGLAHTLEAMDRHPPKAVAEFLTRCIFTSFAEDVGLLPERSWLDLLRSLRENVEVFPEMAKSLWQTMNTGGFRRFSRSMCSSSTAACSRRPKPCRSRSTS